MELDRARNNGADIDGNAEVLHWRDAMPAEGGRAPCSSARARPRSANPCRSGRFSGRLSFPSARTSRPSRPSSRQIRRDRRPPSCRASSFPSTRSSSHRTYRDRRSPSCYASLSFSRAARHRPCRPYPRTWSGRGRTRVLTCPSGFTWPGAYFRAGSPASFNLPGAFSVAAGGDLT